MRTGRDCVLACNAINVTLWMLQVPLECLMFVSL